MTLEPYICIYWKTGYSTFDWDNKCFFFLLLYVAPAMSLRTGWGSIAKSAKNLNATPGFSLCKSIELYLAYGSHAYQYRVDPPNAPMVAWRLLLMLRISLMILICGIASYCSRRIVVGPADWMLRIAFPSWFHNCSIGFRSGLHVGHSLPVICLACRWSRMMILAIWGRTLNQDKCLWTRQWNCETWAMRSCFGWVHSWVLYWVWK